MPIVKCPSSEVLQAYRMGKGSAAARQKMASHLEDCPKCRAALQALNKQGKSAAKGEGKDAASHPQPDNTTVAGFSRDPNTPDTPAGSDNLRRSSLGDLPTGDIYGDEDAGKQPPVDAPQSFDFLPASQVTGDLGKIDQYRVIELLGQGGMGMVFRALDTQLQRPVALKVVKPQVAQTGNTSERFLREARAMAAISSDHVVTVYQVGQTEGLAFLAMELLEGEPLQERLARQDALTLKEALRLAFQITKGLAAAHERGLVHRDIKPANLWIERSGRVKILDFGLAHALTSQDLRLTQAGHIVGTPQYMAPERIEGLQVDARSDLFSLGCVMYELFTGKLAFEGASALAVLRNLTVHHPTPVNELNPDIPEPLSDLVMQLLAKQPDDRPQSAREVQERLRGVVGGSTTRLARRPRAAVPPSEGTTALGGSDDYTLPSGPQRAAQTGSTEVALPTVSRGWLALAAVFLVVLGGLAMWGLVALLRPDIASAPAESPPVPAKQSPPPPAAQTPPDSATPSPTPASPAEQHPPGFPPPPEQADGASESWLPPPPPPGEPFPPGSPPPGFPPPRHDPERKAEDRDLFRPPPKHQPHERWDAKKAERKGEQGKPGSPKKGQPPAKEEAP